MSNGNELERLFKLQAKVNTLVMEGKREPEQVSAALQKILEWKPPHRVTPTVVCIEPEEIWLQSCWRRTDTLDFSETFYDQLMAGSGLFVNVQAQKVLYRPVYTVDIGINVPLPTFPDFRQFLGLLAIFMKQQQGRRKGVLQSNSYCSYAQVKNSDGEVYRVKIHKSSRGQWQFRAERPNQLLMRPGCDRLIMPA